MRSTFKILFYINRGKVKKDGTTAIFCRITVDGEQTVITTGIFCNPNDWKNCAVPAGVKTNIFRPTWAKNKMLNATRSNNAAYGAVFDVFMIESFCR